MPSAGPHQETVDPGYSELPHTGHRPYRMLVGAASSPPPAIPDSQQIPDRTEVFLGAGIEWLPVVAAEV